jgi:hypothetical protein
MFNHEKPAGANENAKKRSRRIADCGLRIFWKVATGEAPGSHDVEPSAF